MNKNEGDIHSGGFFYRFFNKKTKIPKKRIDLFLKQNFYFVCAVFMPYN